jgi:hypothetical protein
MVTRELIRDGHTTRVVVTHGSMGWDVREEQDSQVVRQVTYTDWHRVERAMQAFDLRGDVSPYSTKR